MQEADDIKRAWRCWPDGTPCKTKPILGPDGITRLIRLPNEVWGEIIILINRGDWTSLEDEAAFCLAHAQKIATGEAGVLLLLERYLMDHADRDMYPNVEGRSLSYRHLCR